MPSLGTSAAMCVLLTGRAKCPRLLQAQRCAAAHGSSEEAMLVTMDFPTIVSDIYIFVSHINNALSYYYRVLEHHV